MNRTIKTETPELFEEQLAVCLMELYHLEDINEYKNNTVGKVVDLLQEVKVKGV